MAAARRSPRWPELGAVAGGVLVGWVLAEIRLLEQPQTPTVTELVYLGVGVGMLATGVAARRLRRRRPPGAAVARDGRSPEESGEGR